MAGKRTGKILTDQELAIMTIVWEQGQATVRDVYQALLEKRQIAYTTVMTIMNIMERKGHLKKGRLGRAYLYRPAIPKSQVIRSMVTDFLNRVFEGSAQPLLVHLAKNNEISPEDLDSLRRMVEGEEER